MFTHYYVIDLESWVYPEDERFLGLSSKERKKLDKGYILRSTQALLNLLNRHKVKLTFFILGEIYEWYPDLILEIKKEGHEIGYHTHAHRVIKNSNVLQEELLLSKAFLDDLKPKGFQAPAMFLPQSCYCYLKDKFVYSSSIYFYGKNALKINDFIEIPISTYRFWNNRNEDLFFPRHMTLKLLMKEIPYGSSLFTAILGGRITARIIKKLEKQGLSSKLFIHNWQIFPPKSSSFPDTKFLISHPFYLPYLKNIKKDFEYLLQNFRFVRMNTLI